MLSAFLLIGRYYLPRVQFVAANPLVTLSENPRTKIKKLLRTDFKFQNLETFHPYRHVIYFLLSHSSSAYTHTHRGFLLPPFI